MKYLSTIFPIQCYLLSCLFLLTSNALIGQAISTDWSNTVTGTNDESILAVTETLEGKLISVGKAKQKGGKDGLVIISDLYSGATLKKLVLGRLYRIGMGLLY